MYIVEAIRHPRSVHNLGVQRFWTISLALAATMSLAACASGVGDGGVADLCAVADLPTTTPAEIQVVKNKVDAVFRKRQPFANTERNKRVFKAALSVQMSAEHEQFLAAAVASGGVGIASLFRDSPSVPGYTLNDLPKAQADLRAACRS